MQIDVVQTLADLVAIPSVNPMGQPLSGAPFGEGRLCRHLENLLSGLGMTVTRQAVMPCRENLLARLDGQAATDRGGRVVLFDAHLDTVPADGMTIEPFVPTLRDGRLYGRGSCDVKGGMAAMLAALARLADERPADMATVLLSCTVNEENGFDGAAAMTASWQEPNSGLFRRRPDVAVVAEPTALNVVVAHKGVVRWKCHTEGRACHSSSPADGENAVYRMAHVLRAIERYIREVLSKLPSHALCGPTTLSVGTIHGGSSVNTVPANCTIEIDLRLPPGRQPDEARQDLIDYLQQADEVTFPVQHDPPYLLGPPLSDSSSGALAEELSQVAAEVTGGCEVIGVPYATNAACYSAAGVPSVVFGPGFIEQAHTADEWISLEQLEQAAEIYYRFARGS